MKYFISIIKREFKLYLGNKIMVILFMGGPVLYGFVFNAIYNKGKISSLPVVVIDEDRSALSSRLTDMIDEADITTVKEILHEQTDIKNIFMANAAYAAILIPYRFQSDVLQSKQPEIVAYINNTNLLSSGYVNRSLTLTTGTLNAMLSAQYGKTSDAFRVNTFKLFNTSSNYAVFIWPSYLAIVLQSVVMVVLALSFSSEFELNRLGDLARQANNSALIMLTGKIAFYCLLSAFPLIVYSSYFYLFKQHLPPDIPAALLITWLFILSNCLLGAIAGLLFQKQLTCLQFLMVLSMPVYISSGFSWPYDQTGVLSQIYASLFPFMPFINGLRILLIEQGRLADIADYFQKQLIQLLIYSITAYPILKYKLKTYPSPLGNA